MGTQTIRTDGDDGDARSVQSILSLRHPMALMALRQAELEAYMGITHGHMTVYGYNTWSYDRIWV